MADKNVTKTTSFTVDLVRGFFPLIFAIMFWLIVIGSMVGGAKIFYESSRHSGGAMVLGVLLGLLCGFLVAVWINGVVATLLNIDGNLQYLADREKAKG